jgi:hypothetical protein
MSLMTSESLLSYAHVVGEFGVEGVSGLDFLLSNVSNSLQIQFGQGGGREGILKG